MKLDPKIEDKEILCWLFQCHIGNPLIKHHMSNNVLLLRDMWFLRRLLLVEFSGRIVILEGIIESPEIVIRVVQTEAIPVDDSFKLIPRVIADVAWLLVKKNHLTKNAHKCFKATWIKDEHRQRIKCWNIQTFMTKSRNILYHKIRVEKLESIPVGINDHKARFVINGFLTNSRVDY